MHYIEASVNKLQALTALSLVNTTIIKLQTLKACSPHARELGIAQNDNLDRHPLPNTLSSNEDRDHEWSKISRHVTKKQTLLAIPSQLVYSTSWLRSRSLRSNNMSTTSEACETAFLALLAKQVRPFQTMPRVYSWLALTNMIGSRTILQLLESCPLCGIAPPKSKLTNTEVVPGFVYKINPDFTFYLMWKLFEKIFGSCNHIQTSIYSSFKDSILVKYNQCIQICIANERVRWQHSLNLLPFELYDSTTQSIFPMKVLLSLVPRNYSQSNSTPSSNWTLVFDTEAHFKTTCKHFFWFLHHVMLFCIVRKGQYETWMPDANFAVFPKKDTSRWWVSMFVECCNAWRSREQEASRTWYNFRKWHSLHNFHTG